MNLAYDGMITIATGRSRKEMNWKNKEMLWSDFIKKIENTTRTAESYQDYITSKKDRQDEIKDVGGFVGGHLTGGRRRADAVANRYLITLDIDFGSMELWESFQLLYGNAAAIYSTHKHTPNDPRLRLVIPLDRPVFTDEYQAIERRIAGDLGIDKFDDTTYEPSRLMYWPSTSKDGEYIFQYEDAEWLCADDILNTYLDWQDIASWPESGRIKNKIARTAKKQGDPTEKQGLIGAFCRAYTIEEAIEEFLSDVYSPCTIEGRYTYIQGSTTAGVVTYDSLFAYSHHGTDPAGGKLSNAFDLVRAHRFGLKDEDAKEDTPVNKLPSYMAMMDFIASDMRTKKQLGEDKMREINEDFGEAAIDGDLDWLVLLEADRKGNYKCTIENVKIILENDPNLKGKFAFNDFEKREVKLGKLPWDYDDLDNPYMSDWDDAELRGYLEKIYGLTTWGKIKDALDSTVKKNIFHPVKDYLNSLEWDGVERLENLLIDYLGAEDSRYTREVTKKALVAAVARIYRPGIKFDYVLTPVGDQGIGKSTLIQKLGGKWYSDSFTTVQGKEAIEQIQGVWLVEMGELAGLKKAEVESVKLFISKCSDRYRVAYGKRVEEFPRQCIFFGTTNNGDFLKDPTGNRRFWPVDVGKDLPKKDIFSISGHEIDQIWAEAVKLFRVGEPLFLSKELEEMAREQQAVHAEINEREGMIAEYLDRDLPSNWYSLDMYQRRNFIHNGSDFGGITTGDTFKRKKICAAEIWCELFKGESKDLDRREANEIYKALRNVKGWSAYDTSSSRGRMKFGTYGLQRAYVKQN